MLTQPCTCLVCRMLGSGTARYGGAVEGDHPRVAVGELHRPIPLGTLPRIQGHARDQELPLRQPPDPQLPFGQEAIDLRLLPPLQGVRLPSPSPDRAGEGRELHVPDPQGHARLGHTEPGGDLAQRQAAAAQVACLPLFRELAR